MTPHAMAAELDELCRWVAEARAARLNAEALALVAAGWEREDLVVVTSPLIPDGRVMTRAQGAEHAEELRTAVNAWASPR